MTDDFDPAESLSYFGVDFTKVCCSIVKVGNEWCASVYHREDGVGVSANDFDPVMAMTYAMRDASAFGIRDVFINSLVLCTHPYGVEGAKKNSQTKLVLYCNRL